MGMARTHLGSEMRREQTFDRRHKADLRFRTPWTKFPTVAPDTSLRKAWIRLCWTLESPTGPSVTPAA
jgi:hypothetical protein